MHFTYSTSIFNLIILGIHVFVQLAAAILVYIKKYRPNYQAWRYILLFFVISAAASSTEIALISSQSFILDAYKVLSPHIIIPGFYIFTLLLCYNIELLRPHWLNWKRLSLLFFPSVICAIAVMYFVIKGDITDIYSMAKLQASLSEPNVIARLVFLSLYMPYSIYLISIRIRIKAAYINKYHNILVLVTSLLCITYILSRGLQFYIGYIMHESLYLIVSVLIIYLEHYERLHVPLEKVREYYTWDQLPHTTENTIKTVAESLQKLVDDPSIWKNPQVTGDMLVQMVGTNRTYIQQAAKLLGFATLSDMLNRKRINYICQQLRKDPNISIQMLIEDAGYTSRTTAWRHFTKIVGCTPSEFVERKGSINEQTPN